MVFQQNLLEKAYFIVKMSGPAMVWLASSDFWKAPYIRKRLKGMSTRSQGPLLPVPGNEVEGMSVIQATEPA